MIGRWLLVLCWLLPLAGCSNSADTVVTLWHQMRPEDRAVLDARVIDFEQLHPHVDVRAVYKETEELRSGLESAVLVGEGPDIVYGPSDPLGVYQAIGALQDLSPWFATDDLAEFDQRALVRLPASEGDDSMLVFVGDRFGNHLALIYNRNLIASPPATTDDLVTLAVANTLDEDGDGRTDRYGLVWNYTEPFFVIPFLTGYGGWVFDEDRTTPDGRPLPALDTPQVVAAMQFVSDLRSKHRVLPSSADYNAADELFKAGKAAMIINGDWSWNGYLETEGIDAAVAPLPVVSATGKPMGPMVAPKGYSLSVAAQGDQADLAAELIRFLTNEETQQQFLTQQKILPSRLVLRESPLVAGDPTLLASLAQVENGRQMPTATEMRAVWDGMRPAYQQLMAGNLSAPQAALQMQRDTKSNIATLTSTVQPGLTAPLVSIGGLAMLAGLAL